MPVEHCSECGFDGGDWTDRSAVDAIAQLPDRWRVAADGLSEFDASRRPLPDVWSIAEYADHVREVLFGMRFLLESAIDQPGVNLGSSPPSGFDPEPADIELGRALDGIEREASALAGRFAELEPESWGVAAVVDGDVVDAHWICRHAVHDASHHLLDVDRLKTELGRA